MLNVESSARHFLNRYGYAPSCSAYAPGRVTIIGAHTDYNGGCVISAALAHGTSVSVGESGGRRLRLFSDGHGGPVELTPGEVSQDPNASWTRYVTGVLNELGLPDRALDVSISSTLPAGRGLASSAALTVATALAVAYASAPRSRLELAMLCQRAEAHAGVHCGLLDPYTSLHAEANKLLCIDCAGQTHEYIEFPANLAVVICDSGLGRELAKSQYSLRRKECQQAAAALGHRWLRDATLEELRTLDQGLALPARRAEHVVREIERVKIFSDALRRRDYGSVRRIMQEAQASCRDLLECSTPELDFLVSAAAGLPGCVGARITGAGWGGATVNLVFKELVRQFCQDLTLAYQRFSGCTPSLFVGSPAASAHSSL